MRKLLLILGVLILSINISYSQTDICGYQQPQYNPIEEQQIKDYINSNRTNSVITVPVVFHIVWQTGHPEQNVSDAQIISQIDALNRDFNLLNTDAANAPSIFTPANPNIQFCLATRDPNGNATTGIIRRQSPVAGWDPGNYMAYYNLGGSEAWGGPSSSNPCPYLNIYVCNLNGSVIGVSTLGIVIVDYAYFGTVGTLGSNYNKGRVATHEVGHWLNLRHIWGDANCGDDLVNDTPTHNAANFGCPTYPHKSTCTGTPTEMTMNYMDYTYDQCKYMFTQGQVDRMRATLTPTGTNSGILTSLACTAPTYTTCVIDNFGVTVPDSGKFRVAWTPVPGATSYTLEYSTLYTFGTAKVSLNVTSTDTLITPSPTSVNTSNLDIYYVRVKANCSNSTFAPQLVVNVSKNIGINMLDPILGDTTTTTGGGSTGGGGTTPICPDIYEPNNTLINPVSIATNTDIFGTISPSTDVDCFSFNTTKPFKNVQIALSNLTIDCTLQLHKSDGTLLATSSNAGTTNEVIIANNLPQASYKIKIFSDGLTDSTNCYKLVVNRSKSAFRVTGNETYYENIDTELLETKIYTVTGRLLDLNNTDNLSSGIYIIQYIYEDRIEFEKIIK